MKFRELKKEYQKAVKENAQTFSIEGHLLVVGYAKYLIEYLTSKGVKDTTDISLVPTE
jgi:TRAP-type C4-dicarboxylate transport system substrate-binding protein